MSLTRRFSHACVAALAGLLVLDHTSALYAANANGRVEFDRDIRPIFSVNCFHCHGPDEKARKAKLRLDTKEGTFRVRDGKTVIVRGNSNDSELIRRVTNKDPDEVMPPPEANHKLTSAQIELLRKWIDQGAEWASHWAYKKITSPALPGVKNRAWAANEIDRFVLARLEREQMVPSPRADR